MASISERKNKLNKSYMVTFALNLSGKRWQRVKFFKSKDDAISFLPIATMVESKSKMNLAPPEEVELWVKQNYLTMEEAVKAFPFFAQRLYEEKKGQKPIDWNVIEQEYSDAKLDLAGNKDFFSESHRHKMRLFRRVKGWLQEEHSTLQIERKDIESYLRSMRLAGRKAQTRKHWLITFNLIADIAVRLDMMAENPAKTINDNFKDKVTVSVPSRPKYIKRVLIPKHVAQAVLDWNGNPKGEELHHERKRERKPHLLEGVDIEEVKKLPKILDREDVMKALNVSYASVTRYVSRGVIPKPSTAPIGRKRWSMKRDALVKSLMNIDCVKTPVQRLRPEETTMRGCFPLAFRLGLWSGLRNGECVWLPWDHVDIDNRLLFIGKVVSPLGQTWSPKSDVDNEENATKERTLGMTPSLCRFFEKEKTRQEQAGIKTFFVFPSGHVKKPPEYGKPLGARVLNDAFQKHLQWAGYSKIEKLTFYSLRHTFCTELLRAGVSIEDVRDRMGHTDISTTQTYLHAEDASAHVEDVLERFASDEDSPQTE